MRMAGRFVFVIAADGRRRERNVGPTIRRPVWFASERACRFEARSAFCSAPSRRLRPSCQPTNRRLHICRVRPRLEHRDSWLRSFHTVCGGGGRADRRQDAIMERRSARLLPSVATTTGASDRSTCRSRDGRVWSGDPHLWVGAWVEADWARGVSRIPRAG